MSPELVHLKELSRRLRVPSRWLRAEALGGRLPHIRAGQQLLFDFETVREVLAKRAAGDTDLKGGALAGAESNGD